MGRLQSLFPSHQFDVIIGSLLGDAHLECRSIGLRNPITARLRVHHGEKQKDYVFWKFQVLKAFVSREPREVSWDNPKRGLHEVSWYFHTTSLEELGRIHQSFYKDGMKILPENIFEMLTPRMIAIWFMDDGSRIGKGFTLNTHGFSYEEQLRIVDYLEHRHSITAHIVKDRTKFKIGIGAHDRDRFIKIVQPFIIPSMIYKMNSPRNDLIVQGDQSEKTGSSFSC